MKIKLENKKQKALELMKKLDIYEEYIKGFEENNDICMFERFAGFWAYQYPELINKIKEIEQKYNCLVYAVTHEYTEFGELYDFLVITDYKCEWKNLVENYENNNEFIAFAYVWNASDEYLSEFGNIGIKSRFGGLTRIC